MEKTFFPPDFLDRGDVANLPPDYKLLLAGSMIHHRRQACGAITLTDAVLTSLSFLPSVGKGVAGELARRGLAFFDEGTLEFYVLGQFSWNKTPAEAGENSPWAKHVARTIREIRSPQVKKKVEEEIEAAPSEKTPAIPVPGNLVTALPRRKNGEKWAVSELLLLICLFAWQGGRAPGMFTVDLDAAGGLCSLPAEVIKEACYSLAAADAIFYDDDTREVVMWERLRLAQKWDIPCMIEAAQNIVSRRGKIAVKKFFLQTFRKDIGKTKTCGSVDSSLPKKSRAEEKTPLSSPPPDDQHLPPAGACAAGAQVEEELETLLAYLLSKAKERGGDEERDKETIKKIREIAGVAGAGAVVSVIKLSNLPWPALNACKEAGLEKKAAKTAKEAAAVKEEAARQQRLDYSNKVAAAKYSEEMAIEAAAKDLIGKKLVCLKTGKTVVVEKKLKKIDGFLQPLSFFQRGVMSGEWEVLPT